MSDITLSPTQQLAYSKVMEWFRNGETPYTTLGGYAGTGKTTLIAHIRENLDCEKVFFMAYTGKATMNMKEKLHESHSIQHGDRVSTIHSFLYKAVIDEVTGKILRWEIKPSYDPLYPPGLIIVDEASMVPENIHNDLLELDIPILYVGDHGQLPPIKDKAQGGRDFNLMKEPNIRLEEIHRQALDSPIIMLSFMARQGQHIPDREYGEGVASLRSIRPVQHLLKEGDQKDIMMLTDLNRRRLRLNKTALKHHDLATEHPTEGARVVCLKNNWKVAPTLFNGQLGTVTKVWDAGIYHVGLGIQLDDSDYWEGKVSRFWFNNHNPAIPKDIAWREVGDRFDFGYALTVHKAQGSEAKRVFIFGDGWAFGEHRSKWLYTAITRAKNELYICGDRI